MPLHLITPPVAEPVTLAELKAHLRIAHADEDASLSAFGKAARAAIEARGAIALMPQGWRLTLDAVPQGVVALPRAPVLAIDAVAIVDREGFTETIDPELYEFETGLSARLIARGAFPYQTRRIGGMRIDFTAGFADAASVPEELKLGVKILAAQFYENREGLAPEAAFTVAAAVDALIAPYRRVRL